MKSQKCFVQRDAALSLRSTGPGAMGSSWLGLLGAFGSKYGVREVGEGGRASAPAVCFEHKSLGLL